MALSILLAANNATAVLPTTIPHQMLAEPTARRLPAVTQWSTTENNVTMATMLMTMVAPAARRTAETESNKVLRSAMTELLTAMLFPTDADPTVKDTFAVMV